jgi:hypothetical protein
MEHNETRQKYAIDFDEDLLRLVVLMQRHIPAAKLLPISLALPRLAEVLWADDPIIRVYPEPLSLSAGRPRQPQVASEPLRNCAEDSEHVGGNVA